MVTNEHLVFAREMVETAQVILVIFPSQSKHDVVAAAVSLAHGMEALGKHRQLLSPQNTDFPAVVDLPLSDEVGNKDLRISFPYNENMVDKVSYSIDEDQGQFHLVVQPKSGAAPLDSTQVAFTYVGAQADLIITLGVSDLNSLEQLYVGYESLYADTPLISINTFDTSFGTLKLNISDKSSYCEGLYLLLESLGAPITDNVATTLLAGVEQETQMFRSQVTSADTFETIAKLLRLGARRLQSSAVSANHDNHLNDRMVVNSATSAADSSSFTNTHRQSTTLVRQPHVGSSPAKSESPSEQRSESPSEPPSEIREAKRPRPTLFSSAKK